MTGTTDSCFSELSHYSNLTEFQIHGRYERMDKKFQVLNRVFFNEGTEDEIV